jgi:calreticulin
MKLFLLLSLTVLAASATVFFQDDFSDANWESRWVYSTKRPAGERGEVGLSAGKYFEDEVKERGLKTLEDARFYTLSAEFPEFSNKGKTLVFQYSLKQDQRIDCGGGYLKLHPAGLDQKNYEGDSVYNVMFGPDICGSTRRTHVILTHGGKNHLITNDVSTETDIYTHVYTLIIKPDNTFQVLIDNKEVRAGNFEDDFTILEPKQINDPAVSKPSDWVDETHIDDPEDVKPEGYDEIQPEIDDPEAAKPADWDDELDGEWEAPKVPNPEYKGPWKAKKIPNPAYKGPWTHPKIDNPAYVADANLYAYDSFKYVGIEIWQVKAGSIFGNILVTDDVDAAKTAADNVLTRVEGEKAAEKKEEEAERAKAEAEAAANKDKDDDDEDDKGDKDEKEDL